MATAHATTENSILDFWIELNPNVRIAVVTLAAFALGYFVLYSI